MKKMKDFASGALFLMSAAALLAGFPSCEPQTQPRTAPEDPDPVIDPPTPPGPGSEPEETVIYYDNLDKEKSASNGNYFNTWTACRDMEGTGISDVAYDGFYTSVRSDFESRNYPGASGMNGVYYSKDGGQAYIQVKNISASAFTIRMWATRSFPDRHSASASLMRSPCPQNTGNCRSR